MRLKIMESYDSFRMIRENHAYYVDKTMILKEYLEDHFKPAILFARPRRFGKTMTMTMFRDFLDIRKDSRTLFDGLKIMEHPDTVSAYMNKYPVVFLSLKEVFGGTFREAYDNLAITAATACKMYRELLDSVPNAMPRSRSGMMATYLAGRRCTALGTCSAMSPPSWTAPTARPWGPRAAG